MTASWALTVFNGRAGDHNERAMLGARLIGAELQERLSVDPDTVGTPEPPLNANWDAELAAAMPALRRLQERYEQIHADGRRPITALGRCAAALATLPVVARHHPDAAVVWLDAHADLNTPANSTTGFLGGLSLSGTAGLWDSGLGAGVDTGAIVLVGARDIDPPEQELIDRGLIRHVPVGPALVDDLAAAVADRPIYFHLDCDVLDPGIVPTDYTVPDGLSLDDLHAVTTTLSRGKIIGVEIAAFEGAWAGSDELSRPNALLDALTPLWS